LKPTPAILVLLLLPAFLPSLAWAQTAASVYPIVVSTQNANATTIQDGASSQLAFTFTNPPFNLTPTGGNVLNATNGTLQSVYLDLDVTDPSPITSARAYTIEVDYTGLQNGIQGQHSIVESFNYQFVDVLGIAGFQSTFTTMQDGIVTCGPTTHPLANGYFNPLGIFGIQPSYTANPSATFDWSPHVGAQDLQGSTGFNASNVNGSTGAFSYGVNETLDWYYRDASTNKPVGNANGFLNAATAGFKSLGQIFTGSNTTLLCGGPSGSLSYSTLSPSDINGPVTLTVTTTGPADLLITSHYQFKNATTLKRDLGNTGTNVCQGFDLLLVGCIDPAKIVSLLLNFLETPLTLLTSWVPNGSFVKVGVLSLLQMVNDLAVLLMTIFLGGGSIPPGGVIWSLTVYMLDVGLLVYVWTGKLVDIVAIPWAFLKGMTKFTVWYFYFLFWLLPTKAVELIFAATPIAINVAKGVYDLARGFVSSLIAAGAAAAAAL
jgi:hypothetical protein